MNSTATTSTVAANCHGQAEHTSSPTANQFVARVLELTNQERRKHGLQPLTLNSRLTAAAQAYSKEMALRDRQRLGNQHFSRTDHLVPQQIRVMALSRWAAALS